MIRLDSGIRLDNGGLFLQRQLEQRIPEVYSKRYPNLWAIAGEVLPSVGDLEMGADTITAEILEQAGEAQIYAQGSNDTPLVDVSVSEDQYKVFVFIAAARWSIFELEKARKANKDLNALKLAAVRRAIDERAHKLACFGSVKHGAKGLFNLTGVPVDNNTFDADATATDADDYIQFFGDIITDVSSNSNSVEEVDTILVPEKLLDVGRRLRLPGSQTSALSYVLENWGAANGGSLRRILPKNECQSSYLEAYGVHPTGTNKDRLVLLPSNPDALHRKFYALDFLDPQVQGTDWRVIGYSGASEVLCHYPESLSYVDIPKL